MFKSKTAELRKLKKNSEHRTHFVKTELNLFTTLNFWISLKNTYDFYLEHEDKSNDVLFIFIGSVVWKLHSPAVYIHFYTRL